MAQVKTPKTDREARDTMGMPLDVASKILARLPMPLLIIFLLLAALPIGALLWLAVAKPSDNWGHLLNYVLLSSLKQTIVLLLGVSVGTALLGAGTAWLTTMCTFPGRRIFAWALVLPLAVPTYIAAYSMVEFLEFSGPLQSTLRSVAGFTSRRDYWFPDIRSLPGAILVFTAVLYPYVYLTCRLMFGMQGASALDVCRSLGARPLRMFWQIGLPMARPALAAGIALALMETLNDIGAVEYLGVKTLTFSVFETWLNRDDLVGAMQLAVVLLLVVIGLIMLERKARARRQYQQSTRERPPALLALSRWEQFFAFIACSIPLLVGLGIPIYILGTYSLRRLENLFEPALLVAFWNSMAVSIGTATITTALAFAVLLYARVSKRSSISTIGKVSTLGYAVPGTVLALGLLVPIAGFDNWLDGIMRSTFNISTGLLISGSFAIIIYACSIRFMAIAYGTVESGFARLSPHVDMAARALGRGPMRMALEVHTPIMRRALAAAFLLVFVDTMKELSATIMLRPAYFETLATLIYDRTSQAALEDAAIAALLIVLTGLLPILLLSKMSNHPSS